MTSISATSGSNTQTLEKLSSVDAKVHDFEDSQEAIQNKLTGLEEQVQKLSSRA